MLRSIRWILVKYLPAEWSNLAGFPKDCFVAGRIAMTPDRNIFLTTSVISSRNQLPRSLKPINNAYGSNDDGTRFRQNQTALQDTPDTWVWRKTQIKTHQPGRGNHAKPTAKNYSGSGGITRAVTAVTFDGCFLLCRGWYQWWCLSLRPVREPGNQQLNFTAAVSKNIQYLNSSIDVIRPIFPQGGRAAAAIGPFQKLSTCVFPNTILSIHLHSSTIWQTAGNQLNFLIFI